MMGCETKSGKHSEGVTQFSSRLSLPPIYFRGCVKLDGVTPAICCQSMNFMGSVMLTRSSALPKAVCQWGDP